MPGKNESDWSELGRGLGGEIGKFAGGKLGPSGEWGAGQLGGMVGEAIGAALGAAADAIGEQEFGVDLSDLEPGSGEGDPGPGMSGPTGGVSIDPSGGDPGGGDPSGGDPGGGDPGGGDPSGGDPSGGDPGGGDPSGGDGGGAGSGDGNDYGDEGDSVGGNSGLEERIAATIAKGLASGGIPVPDNSGDGDGTGHMVQDRIVTAITRVLAGYFSKTYDPGDGEGEDFAGGINHNKIAALVARALARGGVAPQPDDSGDGDGPGRPVPDTLGGTNIGP